MHLMDLKNINAYELFQKSNHKRQIVYPTNPIRNNPMQSSINLQSKVILAAAKHARKNAYELYKIVQQQSPEINVKFHSVYSAIRRAEKRGFLDTEWHIPEPGKSPVRLYLVTAQGQVLRSHIMSELQPLCKSNKDKINIPSYPVILSNSSFPQTS
jgi:DNA-binding PadR family transcriptional regulator